MKLVNTRCKKCRLDHSKKNAFYSKWLTEYGKMMAEFNKRKAIKGVMTEQKQVYLSGRA